MFSILAYLVKEIYVAELRGLTFVSAMSYINFTFLFCLVCSVVYIYIYREYTCLVWLDFRNDICSGACKFNYSFDFNEESLVFPFLLLINLPFGKDLDLLTSLAVDIPNISKLFSPLTVVKFYTWTRALFHKYHELFWDLLFRKLQSRQSKLHWL